MPNLQSLLDQSASRHSHLCPRQVLGVRMGLAGAAALGMAIPRTDKRLLVILETDGCFVDGVEITTGCSVGHRTLRVEDYGKVAGTFIQVESERAFRLAPLLNVRERASSYAPDQKRRYFAQLQGYQVMPVEELFSIQAVTLTTPVKAIISRPVVRVNCDICGEEVVNEREIEHKGLTLCLACVRPAYYREVGSGFQAAVNSTMSPQEIHN